MSLSSRGLASLDGEGDTVVLFSQGRSRISFSPSPPEDVGSISFSRKVSPERKTPPGVSAPSAGLRPLIVSRVKCGGRTFSRPLSDSVHEKCDMPSMHFFKLRKI